MYNEVARFDAEKLLEFSSNYAIDFLLVNDGSKDTTGTIIENLAKKDDRIFAMSLSKNSGKAEAIRLGVEKAIATKPYKAIGYLDADFSTPLFEINNLIEIFISQGKPFIMGSRVKRLGATIQRYRFRHFFGRVIATCISEFILKLPVYDTQCGAKLIKTEIAKDLFKDPFVTKWLFDVELIARLKKQYNQDYCVDSIYEMPLTYWNDKGESKITFLDMLSVPFQLLKIYTHYK
jgi:glycosyltransferase involved in cell wall biosynthesis